MKRFGLSVLMLLSLEGVAVAGAGFAQAQQPSLQPALQAQAPQAPGRPDADVLLFTDGEKLTGHFVKSAGASLTFKSDALGEITVDWSKVKELQTSAKVAVISLERELAWRRFNASCIGTAGRSGLRRLSTEAPASTSRCRRRNVRTNQLEKWPSAIFRTSASLPPAKSVVVARAPARSLCRLRLAPAQVRSQRRHLPVEEVADCIATAF